MPRTEPVSLVIDNGYPFDARLHRTVVPEWAAGVVSTAARGHAMTSHEFRGEIEELHSVPDRAIAAYRAPGMVVAALMAHDNLELVISAVHYLKRQQLPLELTVLAVNGPLPQGAPTEEGIYVVEASGDTLQALAQQVIQQLQERRAKMAEHKYRFADSLAKPR